MKLPFSLHGQKHVPSNHVLNHVLSHVGKQRLHDLLHPNEGAAITIRQSIYSTSQQHPYFLFGYLLAAYIAG